MDRKMLLFAALIVFAMAMAGFAQALSSDAVVKTIASRYLEPSEEAVALLPSPVDFEGARYWLVGIHLVSAPETTNVFLAVEDAFGVIEANGERLEKLFLLAGRVEVLAILKKNKLSIDDLELFLADSEARRETAERNFVSSVKQQLELKYQNLDFTPIAAGLQQFKQKQEISRESVRSTQTTRYKFEAFPSTVDFDEYYRQYNATLASFEELAKAADAYHNSLRVFTEEIANSAELNFSDKELINEVLQRLSDIGDYRGFRNNQLNPSARTFNSLSLKSDRLVEDRVGSTLNRVAKKEAETAYTQELEAKMRAFLSQDNEFKLKTCDIDITQIKEEWKFVRAALGVNTTRENLLLVPLKVEAIANSVDAAEARYRECITAPRQPPQPLASDNSGIVNLLIIALVIVVAYAGYKKYRETRLESE